VKTLALVFDIVLTSDQRQRHLSPKLSRIHRGRFGCLRLAKRLRGRLEPRTDPCTDSVRACGNGASEDGCERCEIHTELELSVTCLVRQCAESVPDRH